ncbi:MAG: hypothetical protein OSA97_14205 [Nevskia sp.]|nr:hypothetical protein [Nevskia sp.]
MIGHQVVGIHAHTERVLQLAHILGRNDSEALRLANEFYARTVDEYFQPHRRAGAFRRIPTECFPSLVVGPVHDYARRWLNQQVPSPPTDHLEVFASVAWNSVRNPRKA